MEDPAHAFNSGALPSPLPPNGTREKPARTRRASSFCKPTDRKPSSWADTSPPPSDCCDGARLRLCQTMKPAQIEDLQPGHA